MISLPDVGVNASCFTVLAPAANSERSRGKSSPVGRLLPVATSHGQAGANREILPWRQTQLFFPVLFLYSAIPREEKIQCFAFKFSRIHSGIRRWHQTGRMTQTNPLPLGRDDAPRERANSVGSERYVLIADIGKRCSFAPHI